MSTTVHIRCGKGQQQSSLPVSGLAILYGQPITFSVMDDALQPAFVVGSGSSIENGHGGGEDRFNEASVKLQHH